MSLPNFNPANQGSFSGVITEVLKNYGLQLENSMPAVVQSYDRQKNTVLVTPAINVETTGGEFIQREAIELPVHVLGGGGIILSMPLVAGDTGWIIAGDRDIALFKQSLAVSNPNTRRQHKYSFGFFIPDKVNGISVSQADEDKFVIQTLDGKTKITLKKEEVIVKTDGEVEVEAESSIKAKTDGTLTAEAQSATITASTVTINGDVVVNGSITSTAATIGGVEYNGHVHVSAAAGVDTSAAKNP